MTKTMIVLVVVIALVAAGSAVWFLYAQNTEWGTAILRSTTQQQKKAATPPNTQMIMQATPPLHCAYKSATKSADDGKTGNQICQGDSKICKSGNMLTTWAYFSSKNGTCTDMQSLSYDLSAFPCDVPMPFGEYTCGPNSDGSTGEPGLGDASINHAAMYQFLCCE